MKLCRSAQLLCCLTALAPCQVVSAHAEEANAEPRIAYQPVVFLTEAASLPASRVPVPQSMLPEEKPARTIEFAADIALVSDFRRGGISLTD